LARDQYSRRKSKDKLLPLRREVMLARFHIKKYKERIQQITRAQTPVLPDKRTTHMITVSKKAYLKAAIRCANSIWFHSPEMRIVIHIDEHLAKHQEYLFRKLDRKDRIGIVLEDSFESWQELKLKVILYDLGERDIFSDADLYWNTTIPVSNSGFFFAAENVYLNRDPYSQIIRDCGIQVKPESFMANSSFISLGKLPNKEEFIKEVELNFNKIRIQLLSNTYEEDVCNKILRLSEQLALSISINKHLDHFKALKLSDRPMDGGSAESYYLGATKGWA
jgi:hypothetical protein